MHSGNVRYYRSDDSTTQVSTRIFEQVVRCHQVHWGKKVAPFLRAHGDEVTLLYLLCALFGISSVARSSDQVQCRFGLYLYKEYHGLSGNLLTKAAALPFLTAATPAEEWPRHCKRRSISHQPQGSQANLCNRTLTPSKKWPVPPTFTMSTTQQDSFQTGVQTFSQLGDDPHQDHHLKEQHAGVIICPSRAGNTNWA